jgi:integrase
MTNRPHLLTTSFIETAPDGVHNDGGAIEGCALEIHIRNGGKSKRAYYRYNGTPFGESRTARVSLGSYDQGLAHLRRERVALEQLIEQGKSPKRHRGHQQKQRRAAGMTLRNAMDEFWTFAYRALWSPGVRKYNDRVRRKHLEHLKIVGMPIEDIRAVHLEEAFGEKWRTMSGIGPRIRSLLHSTFQYQIDKDDGVYRGPNPVSWRKTSSLSKLLGPQLPSKPWPGLHHEDVPKVVAYFRAPADHWVPGYLTTMQAAYVWELDPKAIRTSHALGRFQGVIQAPPIWKARTNLFPISELKKKYGEFVNQPKPHEQESAVLNSRLMQFLMFTPVRAAMACGLRWRNIKGDKGYIEYLPKRRDPLTGEMLPSEHKLGWKFNIPYLAILTNNLRELIEASRAQQIRDRIEIKPDGFVFVHGTALTGDKHWFSKPSSHRTLDDYLTKAAFRLRAAGETIRFVPEDAKKATIHGFRGATFTTWAKENGYSDDLINLSLGHVIPAIRENKTNWSYFYNVLLLKDRTEMMTHWERHCLSLCRPKLTVVSASA